ncbi:hypothetical protein MTR67_006906 [Solanum verrucosum]|uniref:Uncharacterized protein n=1 Tax=Solanum verrucosum TaxID=315347 RepID=A0AAF0TC92_SOLVR|nr:hypothetical protein MTR67_006906 [Solanum verrucosum]
MGPSIHPRSVDGGRGLVPVLLSFKSAMVGVNWWYLSVWVVVCDAMHTLHSLRVTCGERLRVVVTRRISSFGVCLDCYFQVLYLKTKANPRRTEKENVDGAVPSQGLQGDQVPIVNQEIEVSVVPPAMTNEEIRAAFLTLAQAMTAQLNRDVGPRVKAIGSTVASILRDFVRMNPPIFLGSRKGEDTQEFWDGVYKIVGAMGVTSREKAELASYKLKEVAQVITARKQLLLWLILGLFLTFFARNWTLKFLILGLNLGHQIIVAFGQFLSLGLELFFPNKKPLDQRLKPIELIIELLGLRSCYGPPWSF